MSTALKLNAENIGMTDDELERMCLPQYTGASVWAYWTSEVYSFGKCLRFWAKYPRMLPLYVYSDHGVSMHAKLFPHELKNKAKVHLTWNPMKEKKYKDLADKKVIQIICPWIPYRKLKGISCSPNPIGTLAFFAHNVPLYEVKGHDSEEYFAKLRNLPEKFQPVVLCLHMHDVNAGHHKNLRQHGFPIVTAGNSSGVNFVDHFYDQVKDYAYATSQSWGSQTAYCVELGIPYFFMGEIPTVINHSHEDLPLGVVQGYYYDTEHEEYDKKAEALFRSPVDSVTNEQRAFVESLLGFDSKITREQVSRILWREFFRHWLKWHLIFKFMLVVIFRKMGCWELIKRFIRYFKRSKF